MDDSVDAGKGVKKVDADTKEPISSIKDTKKAETTSRPKNKSHCKKHSHSFGHTKPKKTKKHERSSEDEGDSSESDPSTISSDSEDTDDESESSSDTDLAKQKKTTKKAKLAQLEKKKQKLKQLKKQKNTKKLIDDDEVTSESGEDSENDALERIKLLAALKRLQPHDDSDSLDTQQSVLRSLKSQLNGLEINQKSLLKHANRNRLLIDRALGQQKRRGLDLGDNLLLSTKSKKIKKLSKKKQNQKRASKVAYKRVDQLWDQTIHNYKLQATVDDDSKDEWDQYIFTVRRRFDWEHKYLETLVDIKSKPLKECLQHVMKGVKGVSLVQDTPQIEPNTLFLYLEESRTYLTELENHAETGKRKEDRKIASVKAQHLRVLVKYLDKDYSEIKTSLYPMLENGMITFDLLWALFKPGTIAHCSTYGDADEPRAFRIEMANKESHFLKGTWYTIEGKYLEYDGKSFGMGTLQSEVSSFQGARKISSLPCYPLKYHKEADRLRERLIERGKKFVSLQGMNYRYHQGMAYTKRKRQVLKININGRVMVDPAIHRRINPNYQISTVKPKDDHDGIDSSEDEGDDSCGCDDESDSDWNDPRCTPTSSEDRDHGHKKFAVVRDEHGHTTLVEIDDNDHDHSFSQESKLSDRKQDTINAFSEEELLIASPVVLGFAFSEKLWLEFTVSGISEVIFNEKAFDSLVLPDNHKSIVKALVSSHAFHPSRSIDDIISGKGKGLVAVLHGPPGTGKTLTAEGIADLLKCPLYMVSAGDLGTDPRTLEKELQNILDIAHSWGAILLLDEADVFLEKRSIQDIHRNALVSIFLRLLEYFQGILFLTTNRVETFDEAFVSRIHLSLRYGELSTKAKRSVWKMFIEKARETEGMEVGSITESDITELARREVNGRQIKNLVRAAQALAVHEGKILTMAHIKRVIDVAESFEMDLKGGSGYSDAMRSVFT